jgi:hypothetical protein
MTDEQLLNAKFGKDEVESAMKAGYLKKNDSLSSKIDTLDELRYRSSRDWLLLWNGEHFLIEKDERAGYQVVFAADDKYHLFELADRIEKIFIEKV